jgi:hypothetical protein
MYQAIHTAKIKAAIVGFVTVAVVGASALAGTAPAGAYELNAGGAPAEVVAPVVDVSAAKLEEAIHQARADGFVEASFVRQDGATVTRVDLGEGFRFDLVQPSPQQERLGAGSDAYGAYVSFNSTDQSAIINGAGWGLGAAVCLISGGTFCVVVGAIIAAATFAVSTNGLRCGTKSLRVYPFSGHNPRCA